MQLTRLALSMLLACIGVNDALAQIASSAEATGATPSVWTCQYLVTPRELWYVRCYDVAVLAAYDPVADQNRPVVWDVPLWGPPMSNERTAELVRAVLCGVALGCAVDVKEGVAVAGTRLH